MIEVKGNFGVNDKAIAILAWLVNAIAIPVSVISKVIKLEGGSDRLS